MTPGRTAGGGVDLGDVVNRLCHPDAVLSRRARMTGAIPLPSKETAVEIFESLRTVLYPGYFGISEVSADTLPFHLGHTLDEIRSKMEIQVARSLAFFSESSLESAELEDRARSITLDFLLRLPEVQEVLADDVQAAYEGDPAALTTDEVVFCYPGILAITSHRIAHELLGMGLQVLPRMISEYAHSVTGIDIHPGAAIGRHFFIDHGTGVVIGETCRIGDRVRIYQGVTLGARSFPLDEDGRPIKGVPRHPLIEDDVTIYSGATILGRITIGAGAVIGGNVWLTRDVAPQSRVSLQRARRELFESGGGI